ncbi:paramyosin-like [Sesbania bispinosa]|nr:paramyosin-like [Sesbania bispinosa]
MISYGYFGVLQWGLLTSTFKDVLRNLKALCSVNKQREVDEINRSRDEIGQVKVSRENEIVELQGEVDRLRGVVENLKESRREFEEKNEQLLSQVQHYKNVVDEVNLEKDDIRNGLDDEKNKVENLELQLAGTERKIEQAEAELGQMRSEQENCSLQRATDSPNPTKPVVGEIDTSPPFQSVKHVVSLFGEGASSGENQTIKKAKPYTVEVYNGAVTSV